MKAHANPTAKQTKKALHVSVTVTARRYLRISTKVANLGPLKLTVTCPP